MQYDVFISCKSEDYKYAEEIYEYLKENGLYVFLASKELRTLGDSEYRKAISKAMKSTYHMIVFASDPDYIDSTWVYYEWDMFINAKLKGFKSGQIVTILKDINIDDVNMDLWKYESFEFSNYKKNLLPYVETPAYLQRQKEEFEKKQEQERNKQLQEEKLKKQKETKEQLIHMAEDYRGKIANLNSVDAKKIIVTLRSIGRSSHTCAICKSVVDIDSTYCPTCGWTISPIDDIEDAEYLSLINTNQLNIAKAIYNKYIDATKLHTQKECFSEEKKQLLATISELSTQVEKMGYQASEMKKTHINMIHDKQLLEISNKDAVAKIHLLETINQKIEMQLTTLQRELQDQLKEKENIQNIYTEKLAKIFNSMQETSKVTDGCYDVILKSVKFDKLQIVRKINELFGVSLKEAKDFVDYAPSVVAENVEEQIANILKKELEQKGGNVIIKPATSSLRHILRKADCNVVLESTGPAKLSIVKTVKELLRIGLKEAKDLADSAPTIIATNIEEHIANILKRELEKIGGTVSITSFTKKKTKETLYDVILESAGPSKLQIVKAVKEALGIGLKEAKDLVDNAPTIIATNIEEHVARNLTHVLEDCGAVASITSASRQSLKQTLYDVVLESTGPAKLQIVKAVKEALGLGLKEAKDLVDNVPTIIATNIEEHVARNLTHVLENCGGVISIKPQY